MRYGFTYAQAQAFCNKIAEKAFNKAKNAGKSLIDCQTAASLAYETEMKFYES